MKSIVSSLRPCVIYGSVLFWPGLGTADAALLEGKAMSVESIHQATSESPPNGIQPPEFIVGPGVEVMSFPNAARPIIPLAVDIDISDRQVLITLLIDQPYAFQEYLYIQDATETIDFIANVFINPATNWASLTPNRVDN